VKPFFSFYGGKWTLAEAYGPPQRDHVIEPFAGSAGYSVHWEPKKVTLIDCDPVVCGIWKYLKRVSPSEIMRLPHDISDIDELPSRLCEEAKWLIGFWFNHALAEPAPRRSNWARTPAQAAFYWGKTIKLRLAKQVERIRHWKIIEGNWENAPDVEAHYFVDPPYANQAGRSYRFNNINRAALAKWCKRRRGFVHVCENDGANWLPFEPFSIVANCHHRGYSAEVVYELEN
jgi:site-specific DNA-adenine methylase